jgi:Fis family transcriptional regulator, factor for inversion stimulation protein
MTPNMTPNLNSSENLFVANLQQVSLEKLVKSKLEVLFQQQKEAQVELSGLYNIVLEQVERPLIELALKAYNGNQVKTAIMLGINRNTLKKKIDTYKLKPKKGAQAQQMTEQATPSAVNSLGTSAVLTQ